MAVSKARRKKAFVTACLTSGFLLCMLMDNRSEHNLKKYQFYHANYAKLHVVEQNNTNLQHCDQETVITSSKLDSRHPWKSDPQCAQLTISHMIPNCRKPTALASFPGSGNTWLRYLIEGATGIFTGSRYKDLQLQMSGLWGEIRSWEDGTTLVQKTHDANKHHVQNDFEGRALLIIRNPYDAILSTHNFLYAGHHGRAPARNYARSDWSQFVTIQTSKWLDMASNWTIYSNPNKVLVVHYEDMKNDMLAEIRRIMDFFHLPIQEERLHCLKKHQKGLFQRDVSKTAEVLPFGPEIRAQLDSVIEHVNQNILASRGYSPMPLHLYNFYKKTDEEILAEIRRKNEKVMKLQKQQSKKEEEEAIKMDRHHGTQMVLEQYIKWLDIEDESFDVGADGSSTDSTKSMMMKQLFKHLRQKSGSKTLTGLSEKAEGILSKAVELWPILQRPFARDPIEDAIETDGFRGKTIEELPKPL